MAADSRSPRDGKHLEFLGYYNPLPGAGYLLGHSLRSPSNVSFAERGFFLPNLCLQCPTKAGNMMPAS